MEEKNERSNDMEIDMELMGQIEKDVILEMDKEGI